MTIVEVTLQSLLRSSHVPPQLVEIISQDQWNALSQSLQEAYREAHVIVCLGELLCCCIFAFPCIFLCHPCIVELAAKDNIHSALHRLNRTYFNGQHVLTTTRHKIISIDTSRILPNGVILINSGVPNPPIPYHVQQPIVQQVYVSQQPPIIYTSQPVYGVPQDNNKVITAVHVAQQVMPQSEFLVVVPNGAYPGSNITVVNPQGMQMLVTVPHGVQPGQQIVVRY